MILTKQQYNHVIGIFKRSLFKEITPEWLQTLCDHDVTLLFYFYDNNINNFENNMKKGAIKYNKNEAIKNNQINIKLVDIIFQELKYRSISDHIKTLQSL